MMRILFFIIFCFLANAIYGQTSTGTVSFISAQSVYVKFASTADISIGDTLFLKKGNTPFPALVVTSKSSISCVCSPLVDLAGVKVSDEVFFEKKTVPPMVPVPEKPLDPPAEKPETTAAPPSVTPSEDEGDMGFKEKLKGRISAASYSNLSSDRELHRMRYAFIFSGNNIKNTRFSTDNYLTFRHTIGEWGQVKDNLASALIIYSLSVKYDFDKTTSLVFGRKINQRLSSMGAIDGLQFEKGMGRQFRLGLLAGARPDYRDFSINMDLLQAGAYVSHISEPGKKQQQSTLGLIEQRNGGNVDRRFAYFQHSNNLAKNMTFFVSAEMDLYEKIGGEVKNKPTLTNIFTSLRYRFSKKLSVTASYDARKNIVLYESYKNRIDSLFENETRQGLRFGINLRPHKLVTWGVNGSMRFQGSGANSARNLNSFLNFSRLPGIKAQASLTANFLETGFMTSSIYGARISKDLIKNKVSGEAYFRWVAYDYKSQETATRQKIGGLNLTAQLTKKLSLYLYYEGIVDDRSPTLSRINTKIIQRF